MLAMRIAIVGDPAAVNPLLTAIAADPANELIAVASSTEPTGEPSRLPHDVRRSRSWEELLSDRELAAVVIADDSEQSLAAARQFASAGKALLLAPRVARAATFAYELSLLQAEQPVPLVPLYALRAHPLVQKLSRLVCSGEFGRIRHIQLEAQVVPSSNDQTNPRLSMDDVAHRFLEDVDVLRQLGGDFDQVTAIRSGDAASGISLQTITLSGPGLPQAIWTATPGALPEGRLQVVSERGTASLAGNPVTGDLTLEVRMVDTPGIVERGRFDPAAWHPALAAATPTGRSAVNVATADENQPTWDDFTRAVELFDAVERSIRRRRMIEIHFESQSERGQFKTYMTAAGCSLLSLTLVAVITYLTAASLIELPGIVKKVLVGLIFLPLGLFLGLQALILLARPSADSKTGVSSQ